MASLADAVQGAVGQPASIRIGIVDSVSPLAISAQGVAFEDVGVLPGLQPLLGATVVLLGQCSQTGSDPASWLCLGSPQNATVYSATVQDFNNNAQSTASTVYVLGANIVGVPFVAPASGAVLIHHFASIDNSAAGSGFVSPEIRLGAVIGSGTVVTAASDQNALRNANVEFVKAGLTMLYSGLTPGTQYNASLWHRSSVGTNTAFFNDRNIIVQPL